MNFPLYIQLQKQTSFSVGENLRPGAVVGTLSARDLDGNQIFYYIKGSMHYPSACLSVLPFVCPPIVLLVWSGLHGTVRLCVGLSYRLYVCPPIVLLVWSGLDGTVCLFVCLSCRLSVHL